MEALGKSLDLYLLRHSVTSDNIANAETPGFKARRVEFESALQSAVDEGKDIESVGAILREDESSPIGQDLNTVDMDKEMSEMSKNDVKYSAATQAVSKKFALLRYAITEGAEK